MVMQGALTGNRNINLMCECFASSYKFFFHKTLAKWCSDKSRYLLSAVLQARATAVCATQILL